MNREDRIKTLVDGLRRRIIPVIKCGWCGTSVTYTDESNPFNYVESWLELKIVEGWGFMLQRVTCPICSNNPNRVDGCPGNSLFAEKEKGRISGPY